MASTLITWLMLFLAWLGGQTAPVATLNSLERVDDYPLYTMTYHGSYEETTALFERATSSVAEPAWACSLFTAFADTNNALYGRNFDWDYSPALLLFTDPPDAYASVSMVDIVYLGFSQAELGTLTETPLWGRGALLNAPYLPFDGMNEHGLAVGMAAVPGNRMPHDPNNETIGSLGIIRVMLDHARDVDEAVALMESYNISMEGGPSVHYLIADTTGRSVLVEFYDGEMRIMPNTADWQTATNFLRSEAESAEGHCWRYDLLSESLGAADGRLGVQDTMELLGSVAQEGTQWSVVYGMHSGDIHVAMGRAYDDAHTLHLRMAGE